MLVRHLSPYIRILSTIQEPAMTSSISDKSPPRVPTTSIAAEISDSPLPTPVTPSNPLHPRSCTFCRQRKVKCDRQKPCSHCLRANNDCSYPAGRGRAAKKPARTLDTRLVDRLQKLENIIKQLNSEVDATANAVPSGSGTDGESVSTPGGMRNDPPGVDNSAPDASIDQQLGRLMIDDSKSYYVSNILWANLGNEVSPPTPHFIHRRCLLACYSDRRITRHVTGHSV